MAGELFVGGTWIAGEGAALRVINPAAGETDWEGASGSAAQVGAAVEAARRAFPSWARTPLSRRIEIAQAFAKEVDARSALLAETISRQMGKALWDSRTEVQAVIGKIALSIRMQNIRAGESEEKAAFGATALSHRPHGVMAVFGPFNFPAHLPNGHIVPALLAGNTVVFKPSELAPGAGAILAQAWEAAGLPSSVFNLVQGGRDVGEALLSAEINGVLFTGSASTGVAIHRRFAGRPDVLLALEMGGNNPLIVWPPADPNAAANLIAHSAFLTTGQRCSCARRLILPADRFGDEVMERLVALAESLRVGAWDAQPEPFMGPLVSEKAVRDAKAAQDRLGGRLITSFAAEGAFVRPALMEFGDGQSAPDEEIFAPFLQIYRAKSFDEAITRANDTRFGLAGGLICDDRARWETVRNELRVGVLNWNRPTTGASGALPFGGPGLSGNLRPSAAYAADYAAYPVAMQIAERATALPAPGLPE